MWVLDHPEAAVAVCVVLLAGVAAVALLAPPRRPRTHGTVLDFTRKRVS
jgi:hypothetical protein